MAGLTAVCGQAVARAEIAGGISAAVTTTSALPFEGGGRYATLPAVITHVSLAPASQAVSEAQHESPSPAEPATAAISPKPHLPFYRTDVRLLLFRHNIALSGRLLLKPPSFSS